MISDRDANTAITLHANRIKGLLFVALITLLCVLLANWSVEHTNIFIPFVLLFWTFLAFFVSYAFAARYPHLFFYELVITENPAIIHDMATNDKVKRLLLDPKAIDHYNIISGYKKRFGYAIRATREGKKRVFFIVPKLFKDIVNKKKGREQIKIGEYYQKPENFRNEYDIVKQFLKSRCKEQKEPGDTGIRILYMLPVILFFVVLVFCISFPIYIITSL
ncbi:hypothetical protein ED312_11925 [Sinomicrobium pectinilyticum]|uniref:Uncharacterized protein n=1 Tax=Sinomicrobium pectinilyticum TaxID=1084421 RepID=A0A3N0EDM7_SINP1|nr:hypothetical protein [Sinomicrobium pectinilyticum]RNL85958.1 hypothetical protein ED312_11925 [Sinomicrobium pectinilyticum]